MIKQFYKKYIYPYLLIIKISLIIFSLCGSFYFGYSYAKNKYSVHELKSANKELSKVIDKSNKNTKEFNKGEVKKIEKVTSGNDERQKKYEQQQKQIELLKKQLNNNKDKFKECVLPEESLKSINENITGKNNL